eukprot:1919221-Prymnesium_polylepis.1
MGAARARRRGWRSGDSSSSARRVPAPARRGGAKGRRPLLYPAAASRAQPDDALLFVHGRVGRAHVRRRAEL